MPNYCRAIIPGGTFFFTVVTFDRNPTLTTELSRQILRRVWKRVQRAAIWQCRFLEHTIRKRRNNQAITDMENMGE